MLSSRTLGARFFALGYAAGVGVYFLLNLVGNLVLRDPCVGHTTFGLVAPLLLGPGGIAVAASGFSRGRRDLGAFGVGLAVSSLFPALYGASRDLLYLRSIGCSPMTTPVTPPAGGPLGR
ncbi:hypothetical protein [Deinococcus pimensis]|uniref:hypothetical protein n=1 Tax=Deinococcus pimensis TaxID=309888 RepID=UPI000694B785|nr:hypothetical protein [Deinococcus pimensis]